VVLLEINPETSRFSRRKDFDPDQLSHRRPPPHTSPKPSTSARRWFESSPRRLTSRRPVIPFGREFKILELCQAAVLCRA
ncbi:hypothetical protein U1Q18_041562, partial [Sarracenia purpurea var. burkii]